MANMVQFVSFTIDGQLYGLDVLIVKEINPLVAVTPVPRAPQVIKGLVNIRGQVVLVMDLAVIFGRPPRPASPDSQLVVLKTDAELDAVRGREDQVLDITLGDKPIGLAVDSIDDVITVAADRLEVVPPHVDAVNARFLEGVLRLGDALQLILNAREVLADSGGAAGARVEQ